MTIDMIAGATLAREALARVSPPDQLVTSHLAPDLAASDRVTSEFVTSEGFRAAMRQLAGAVSIVSVGRGAEISGMTATSVTSLSAEPPRLLVCINRTASSWPLLERHRSFAVNILDAHQRHIADRFAGRHGVSGAARFEGASWTALVTGTPVLATALATLDCRVEEVIERHSHAIVIGEVVAIGVRDQGAALAYWRGNYVALDNEEEAARLAAEVSVPRRRGSVEFEEKRHGPVARST